MNIIDRFKKNTPIKWKVIGAALVAATTPVMQYFIADHSTSLILGGIMFAGYLITNLAVEDKQ